MMSPATRRVADVRYRLVPVDPETSPRDPDVDAAVAAWQRKLDEADPRGAAVIGRADRDYTEKRDEYGTLGVKEYWIVDAKLKQVLVLRRGRSRWTETTLAPADACETKLLPGFKLPCQAVFDAGGDEE